MRKIVGYGKETHYRKHLSWYIAGPKSSAELANEFRSIINSQPMDPVAICNALNSHRWICYHFEPYMPLDDGFKLIGTDRHGNQDIIRITEVED